MNVKKQKTALITGATGGVGYELCQLFACDKINLVLVARNQQKLNRLREQLQTDYGITVDIFALDLTISGAVNNLYQNIQQKRLRIDYLINNAGVGNYGLFVDADFDDLSDLLTLNITALVQLTRKLLPEMIQQGSGGILNVASLAAFQPGGPKEAVYYASKNFVLAFNRALVNELKHTPLTSTAFCPGPLKTDFAEQDGLGSTRLYRYLSVNPRQPVEKAYKAFLKGRSTVTPGFINKLLAIGGEFPPRNIALKLNKFLLEK